MRSITGTVRWITAGTPAAGQVLDRKPTGATDIPLSGRKR
jgi:hypothetical protein